MSRCLALSLFLISQAAYAAEPLRIYIRSGAKTHAPGTHEHPKFLADWTKLLQERGAKCEGSAEFPTPEQLEATDVVLIYTADGGDFNDEQRQSLQAFLQRGKGLVVILDGVCGHDPHWFKTVTGVAWEYNHTQPFYTKLRLRIQDKQHPITVGSVDFPLDDEIFDRLHVLPEAHVLAHSEYVPKGAPAGETKSIPQIWTFEKDSYRAFTSIPGLRFATFSVPSYRALLLRGIAWAGHREQIDEFCTPEELAAVRGQVKPE
jgi:type 1 glutamine amidotransferase